MLHISPSMPSHSTLGEGDFFSEMMRSDVTTCGSSRWGWSWGLGLECAAPVGWGVPAVVRGVSGTRRHRYRRFLTKTRLLAVLM